MKHVLVTAAEARDLFAAERAKRPELTAVFANAHTSVNATRHEWRNFWRTFYGTKPMSFIGDGCYLVHPKPRAI